MSAEQKKICILYVSDNEMDIELTVNQFNTEGTSFEIDTVNSGFDFLKRIQEKEYDVFLLENNLPDTIGVNLIKNLVTNRIKTPSILITGLGDDELVINSLRLGAADYIPKHGDYISQLPSVIKNVLEKNKKYTDDVSYFKFDNINVLYIEHDIMDVEQTINFFNLEYPYINIIAKYNVDEALEYLEKNQNINVILCNLRIPDQNGIEMLHKLRQKKIFIPFVMITSAGDESSALASLKLGAYDFIAKTKHYLEQLPNILQNAYIRFNLDQINNELYRKTNDLNEELERKVIERTRDLMNEIAKKENVEKELRESLRRYKIIADFNYEWEFWIDSDTHKFIYISPSVERITGYAAKDFYDDFELIYNLIVDDDKKLFLNHQKSCMMDNGIQKFSFRLKKKNGEVIYINHICFPIYDDLGAPLGRRGTNIDITELKKYESHLEKTNTTLAEKTLFLDTLLNTTPEIVYIYDLILKKNVYINKSIVMLMGFTPEEIESFGDQILEKLIHKDDFKNYNNNIYPKYFNLKDGEVIDHTYRMINKHLEWRWIRSKEVVFYRDIEGHVRQIIGIAEDITDQKRITEEIERSRERYKTFIEHSAESIWLFELEVPLDIALPVEKQLDLIYENAYISECNKTFVEHHGYVEPSEMTGIKYGTVFPRLAADNLNTLKDFIKSNYKIVNKESKELHRDGSIKYFMNNYIGIIEDRKLMRIWGVKHDITSTKLVEEKIRSLNEQLEEKVKIRTRQLEIINKELESFSYSVSHDLKAPLRGIHGFAKILYEEAKSKLNEDEVGYLSDILYNSTRMNTLIEDLLRLSRINTSKLTFLKTNIQELVKDVVDDLLKGKDTSKIQIKIKKIPSIYADVSLMRQVLVNLLSNSLKFSSKKDKQIVEIGCIRSKDHITYFVKDNGVGFENQYSHKLFNVFQRLHSTEEFEGTGVGLAIVKRIISRHNGLVWAESEPGNGATFYFKLPKKIIR